MCLRNSTAVPCWPGMSIEKKLARTVHSSVVTCAPCCSWSLLLMFSVIKYIWFHFFENYPFPHHLHKFPVYPRFVAVFCFSCALSGCLIFRAWLRLSSFPSLGFGCLVFPHFATSSWFSRAWLRLRCFPALGSGFLFSRAFLRMGCFFRAWLRSRFFSPRVVVSVVFRTWRIWQQIFSGPLFSPWFFALVHCLHDSL